MKPSLVVLPLFASAGHKQNWIYDFLSSDWLTQNQNIAYSAKELRPKKMAAMSRRKPLQRYSWYDGILPNYRSLDFKNLRTIPSRSRFLFFSLLELRDTQKLADYKLWSATLFTTSSHDVGRLTFSIRESQEKWTLPYSVHIYPKQA